MPRSIEEIQRDLEQSNANITAIAKQSQRINQGIQAMSHQEQMIAQNALAPTQIENKRLLTEIKGSISSMEREINEAAVNIENAYDRFKDIDIQSINQSTQSMNEVLKLADPERRAELITALDSAYQERKDILERAYQEQKAEYDNLIAEKKKRADELDEKYKSLNIKRIVRNTVIGIIILFLLAFSVRWGTLLRNKISNSGANTEQTEEISAETENTATEQSKGLLEWLFPTDND